MAYDVVQKNRCLMWVLNYIYTCWQTEVMTSLLRICKTLEMTWSQKWTLIDATIGPDWSYGHLIRSKYFLKLWRIDLYCFEAINVANGGLVEPLKWFA